MTIGLAREHFSEFAALLLAFTGSSRPSFRFGSVPNENLKFVCFFVEGGMAE
jgi:hypothetical protein